MVKYRFKIRSEERWGGECGPPLYTENGNRNEAPGGADEVCILLKCVCVCRSLSFLEIILYINLCEVCNPNSVLTAALILQPFDFLSIITSNRNQTITHSCVRSGSHNSDLTFRGSSHKNLGTEIMTVAGEKDRFRKRSSSSQEEFLTHREYSINAHCCQGTTVPLTHLRWSLTLWVHTEFCLSFENSRS